MKNNNLLKPIEFDRLSLNEKRVAIAKDVITRINNSNLIEIRGQIIGNYIELPMIDDPRDEINEETCEVCARGAVLCSWIGNFNNVGWEELNKIGEASCANNDNSSTVFPTALLDVFDRVMLDNIEAAFEASVYDWHYDEVETQKYVDAFARENEYGNAEYASIIELMEWIIKNEGEFPLPE
jgi:hypothetical protein